tara:strand:- start:212 stop:1198 length:987 start_codon:yes stop_codon:yes gene_type:complete
MSNKNISIKMNDYDKTFLNTRLEFNIKGKDASYPLVNSIRRTALSDIPIYCWNTTITKNNSVFHNNYMRNRIKAIPVIGIENKLVFFKKEESNENDDIEDNFVSIDNVDINSTEEEIDTSSLNNLNMYLDFKNNSKDIVTVSTNNCTFNYRGKKISNPYLTPIPIIKLQPNQEIKLSSVSTLGTELKMSAKYSACSIFSYEMIDENNYNIFVESRGQIDEKEILVRSIENLKKDILDLNESIPDKNEMVGTLKIGDYDHTIGNIIAYYALQDNNVDMFSYNVPHPLDRVINFNYRLNKGEVNDVFSRTVNKIIKDLDTIMLQIKKFKI